ncbi:MAG: hypothetical protein ACD_31C00005G0082 [uncultured bacterium]|uniref:Uncharacterized protein n=3 Tax=Candidatus Daviesiibacteriota TaxID=1752718 RepID=A0A0G0FA29_9BACT|nr:MAG: hypothetical protein ACD_31C00005G0082 [uncultured bacterium]KKQ10375.1 MAG: hypothetical protein US19_C0006G0017 [Candidatus Daviesbacteria bacterium GW2011_GWB1_36_5]KKQ15504.1 MAG: hypothetical protein US28_C0015G0005 [Candidatus Daviesbacteria bacterium GW2011_GWA1_36_8]OGE17797.1 MAG: hypothetical protein A2858_03570 [Candidatus Daviesbacteria bacterium RIFCSPHIGHO2_01_FULL_36_37]
MKKIKRFLPLLLLTLIVLFFLATRLYKINEIPGTLYWDEASIGYNAYSITTDLKDEWGEFLPIHFRAFGEFKLPVYIYSVAFIEKIAGMSILAVRLPAVIFSAGSIVLLYLITLAFYKKHLVSLISSFLFTIFPWYFIFSRTGYEVTAGLMFFLLGLYLLLEVLKYPKFLVLSSLSFILSMYSYNSFRILVPITIAVIGVYCYLNIREKRRFILPAALSFVLVGLSLTPIINLNRLDYGNSRFNAVRIEKDSDFFGNYVKHFDPNFLFLSGDKNPRSQIPGMGQLYIWTAPFLLFGIYSLLRKPTFKNNLPILFVLIAPIPAAITKESPHALRSIAALPFLSMISAFGLVSLAELFKNKAYLLLFLIPFLLSFGFYYFTFINYYPVYSDSWQYGYNQFFQKYKEKFSEYDNVVITDSDAQPYIFALSNLTYDPKNFRQEVSFNSPDKWGISTVNRFNKFRFEKVSYENIPSGRSLVLVKNNEALKNLAAKEFIQNMGMGGGYFVYDVTK